ncbi:MAG TPA: carboxypeptidase regulatory-like domain-containing protein [Flavobacterium sp.]
MKKITLLFLVVLSGMLGVSCSSDDEKSTAAGELQLTGTVMAPNNAFPISRAKVKVYQNGDLLSQTTADAVGAFVVDNLPNGELTVELSKGKFKRELTIDLQEDYTLGADERTFNVFPNIAVVTGYYDEIEQILFNIGIVDPATGEPAFDIIDGNATGRPSVAIRGHGNIATRNASSMPSNVDFTFDEFLLDSEQMSTYDIIFLNCGADTDLASDPTVIANLQAFVQDGGIIYATDWMFKYLQSAFDSTDYLLFSTPEYGGSSMTADVQIANADLEAWLASQGIDTSSSLEINGFLGGWQMVDNFNPANVTNWMIADQVQYSGATFTDKSLAFTFQAGDGGVFYSSFHTHGNNTSEATITEMMNYFVFALAEL